MHYPPQAFRSQPERADFFVHMGWDIDLPPEFEPLLQAMFTSARRLAIKREFGEGLGGGRVFQIEATDAADPVPQPLMRSRAGHPKQHARLFVDSGRLIRRPGRPR